MKQIRKENPYDDKSKPMLGVRGCKYHFWEKV